MPLILDSPSQSSLESETDICEERRRLLHEADVVIVGAGVVGSALAVALGDQGRSVILLEKSLKEPNRIVGELLQPGGVEALTKLGLRHCLDDIDSIKVEGYGVMYYGEQVQISYPNNAVQQSTDPSAKPTKAQGRSFHHGRFISKLRAAAMAHPNVTVFETEVLKDGAILIDSPICSRVTGVRALTHKTKQDYFFAPLTFFADGYNSRFREPYTKHKPISKSKFWGLELQHESCPLPLPYHGQVLISDAPPTLLYQIGSHETRVLVDIPENTPTAAGKDGVSNHLRNVVLPRLPANLQPLFLAAVERGGLRSMPNSFLPASKNRAPGVALLGDALNMRHPLTGGGMTVGLTDIVLITELLSPAIVPDFDNTTLVLKQLSTFHWRRKNLSSVINILAQALYSLFAANDPYLGHLQRGCFRYFQIGGNCIDGPVGLLGGIIRQPLVLVYHFFRVAFLSIWVMTVENGFLGFISGKSLFEAFMIFWNACGVFLPYIVVELKN